MFKYGADPRVKDGDGRTPLDVAYQEKNEAAIAYLLEFGAKSSKSRSPKHAEQMRLEENARGIFLRGSGCRRNVRLWRDELWNDAFCLGQSMGDYGRSEAASQRRCPGGAAIHWVLMKNNGDVAIGANNLLTGGQGVFELDVVEKSGGDPLLFFVSDDFVGNLAKAVENHTARFAGQVTMTAGTPTKR